MFGLLLLLPVVGVSLGDLFELPVRGALVAGAVPLFFVPLAGLFTLGAMPLAVPAPLLILAVPVLAVPTLVGLSAVFL